jgi:D-alanine-D-alanine ligase
MHIGVLFGSRSVEHEVSIITALQAINTLTASNTHKIVPVYISKQGDYYTGDYLLNIEHYKDLNLVMEKSQKVHLTRQDGRACLIKSPVKSLGKNVVAYFDVAFPIIHGSFGEDGTIQGLFEQLQIPYVGCSVLSAALTMDKITAKMVLMASGVPVVDFLWFHSEEWFAKDDALILDSEKKFGYPVIVKPADIGSSVGVSVARNKDEFVEAVNLVRQFSERVLIEKYVQNLKEINISVLGDCEGHKLSVCEEPISANAFLTYADKYAGGSDSGKGSKSGLGASSGEASGGMSTAKREIPAKLSKALKDTIESYASTSFRALDCSGVSRIDFIIDQDDDSVYVNEFNTIPGSLAFYLWEASGKPFAEMIEELIQLGLKRKRRRDKLTFSNNVNILANANLDGIKK